MSDSLREFLQAYAREKRLSDDKDMRYYRAFVDLNDDGQKEAIVFLIGRWWCGSSGCPTLILAPTTTSWRVVARLPATDIPIRVLNARSKRWRNISVCVHGPGLPQSEVALRFDGRTYPSSSATPVIKEAPGEVVISSSNSPIYLYR
jgi:hypothetical protein